MKKLNKGFVKIENVFLSQYQNNKINEEFWKYKILKNWQSAACGFFQEAKDLTQAVDFKNGVLFVACLSQELARMLKLFAEKIILALNQFLGKTAVYCLRIET